MKWEQKEGIGYNWENETKILFKTVEGNPNFVLYNTSVIDKCEKRTGYCITGKI